MLKNRTKIVCTVGPACWDRKTLTAMARAGMDMVRLNMAHGEYAEHQKIIALVRDIGRELNIPLGIEVDLQGPKIRVGKIIEEGVKLVEGKELVFTTNPKYAKKVARDLATDKVFVQYHNLHRDVDAGARLLLADGKMAVKVLAIHGHDIVCRVTTGGLLTSHKGLNFPDTSISVATITDKDKEDLKFALQNDADWVGLSFVRAPEDIEELRELIAKYSHGKKPATKITAKIETHEALDHLEKIIAVSDGIVIARGDLGPEVSMTAVPEYQKKITTVSLALMKPVIVATQMLYSMVANPRPTRAEASDVANAVFDHVDAIYLSDETASGKYPVEAVRVASQVIKDAEKSIYDNLADLKPLAIKGADQALISLARHAAQVAREIKARAIVVTTVTGQTAQAVSSARVEIPVIAVSAHKKIQRQLNLIWGVDPVVMADIVSINSLTPDLHHFLNKNYRVKPGDKVVFVDGVKKDKTEGENLVRVIEIK